MTVLGTKMVTAKLTTNVLRVKTITATRTMAVWGPKICIARRAVDIFTLETAAELPRRQGVCTLRAPFSCSEWFALEKRDPAGIYRRRVRKYFAQATDRSLLTIYVIPR